MVEADIVPEVAVIVVDPRPVLVASPPLPIMATEADDDVQVTEVVRSLLDPLL
jgi:hypothetical protein